MRLLPITSSMIASIGWKPYLSPESLGRLGVVFQNGLAYLYSDVPIYTFVEVITDPDSQGKAFNEKVKGQGFPYAKCLQSDLEEM